ncbi:HAD-IA family hydrolase [Devosia sp.]|uniref:HAD family hydrolase n=1 Tax=Devosia sp. TaxID=1871048 RepID=UPI0032658633
MNPVSGAGLLFDIDGTLIDSDALHLKAFNILLEPYGHHFDKVRFTAELQGFSNLSIGQRFLNGEPAERQAEILRGKEALFRDLATGALEPVHGLMALLDAADVAGLPMIAVTNAPRLNAEMMLGAVGITRRFKGLIIGEELTHGKPHPLPYLEGLRQLGADPRYCVAFEDSRTGIASAVAAGLDTIGMMSSLSTDQVIDAGAILASADFADPALLAFIDRKVSGR